MLVGCGVARTAAATPLSRAESIFVAALATSLPCWAYAAAMSVVLSSASDMIHPGWRCRPRAVAQTCPILVS